MDIENILKIAAACFAAYVFLTWLLYEASKYFCSRIKKIDKLFQIFRKFEIMQAGFIVAFGFILFTSYWVSDINEGQREEMASIRKERVQYSLELENANKKILALENEKRFVVVEPSKEEPKQKQEKQESQEEIILAIKKMEEKEREEREQRELALMQQKINDLKNEINSVLQMQAQASAFQQTAPAGKIVEAVAI